MWTARSTSDNRIASSTLSVLSMFTRVIWLGADKEGNALYECSPGKWRDTVQPETANAAARWMVTTLRSVCCRGCRYSADKNEIITFDASKSVSNDPDLPITQYIWFLVMEKSIW
jgi:hypothetical protein